MKRRVFLKQSCLFCLGAGGGGTLLSLASCASVPTVREEIIDGSVRIPLSVFGSGNTAVVQVPSLGYDLGLLREDGSYTALLLKCTHAETQLTPTGDSYRCSAHGSWFDQSGKVRKGPASKDLERYPAVETDGQVVVRIPTR